jgi:hypothetical protein
MEEVTRVTATTAPGEGLLTSPIAAGGPSMQFGITGALLTLSLATDPPTHQFNLPFFLMSCLLSFVCFFITERSSALHQELGLKVLERARVAFKAVTLVVGSCAGKLRSSHLESSPRWS